MIGRRAILGGMLVAPRCGALAGDRLGDIEHTHGGRLGVAILDTATGRRITHRGDERFPMCSTFEFLATACVLSRADRRIDQLSRRIVFSQQDLLDYAPVTKSHVGDAGSGPALNNAVNDIAVIWPPHRPPLIVTAYYAFSEDTLAQREAVLSNVAQFSTGI